MSGGGPIGHTSALLAKGDGDAGCTPDRYDDDRPAARAALSALSAVLLSFSERAISSGVFFYHYYYSNSSEYASVTVAE